ncbi:hypothetical protein K491DRAFT_675747 [Lophiostoma macrostomum CBS 122681]|uniref:Uncharacterized protein n=1 Tax=Lophiostoma macrostomum CBS 122681 TaxID=1314788 RepID=A0A6A6TJZ9_9PLEO|nr:hypothetical protein K491DRAFT_675747 [Lophiostoma macrostomum CBS 122681]
MADSAVTPAPPTLKVKSQSCCVNCLATFLLAIATAPYRRSFYMYTWKPLVELRRAGDDRAKVVALVKDFKSDKYAELQSAQVAGSFCAGAVFATINWSKQGNAHWTADALFFCSLACSLWAVITSIQSKSILDDLPNDDQLNSSLPIDEVQRMRRSILRYRKRPGIRHCAMIFIWQFSTMMSSYGWVTFVAGLTVYMCTPFIKGEEWSQKHLIAIIYLTTGFIGLVTYLSSTLFVYVGEKDYLQSVASSKVSTSDSEDAIGAQRSTMLPKNGTSSAGKTKMPARARTLYDGYEPGDLEWHRPQRKRRLLI